MSNKEKPELNFPKPEQNEMTKNRAERDGKEEARLLLDVTERICPEGMKPAGSFAVHIYESRFSIAKSFVFFVQTTDMTKVPEKMSIEAVNELTRSLALK